MEFIKMILKKPFVAAAILLTSLSFFTPNFCFADCLSIYDKGTKYWITDYDYVKHRRKLVVRLTIDKRYTEKCLEQLCRSIYASESSAIKAFFILRLKDRPEASWANINFLPQYEASFSGATLEEYENLKKVTLSNENNAIPTAGEWIEQWTTGVQKTFLIRIKNTFHIVSVDPSLKIVTDEKYRISKKSGKNGDVFYLKPYVRTYTEDGETYKNDEYFIDAKGLLHYSNSELPSDWLPTIKTLSFTPSLLEK